LKQIKTKEKNKLLKTKEKASCLKTKELFYKQLEKLALETYRYFCFEGDFLFFPTSIC